MTHLVVILALAFAVVVGGVGPSAAQTARALPDFDVLWDEAKRWAVETGPVPEDCVFDFRFDPKTNAPRDGRAVTEWTYGPCALSREQYWMFEQYPPGRKTVVHGPYAEYGQCEGDRRRTKTGKAIASVGGHCERKAKASFRMTNDGTLIVPKDAPSLD